MAVLNPLNGKLENRSCIVDRASGVRRLGLSHKFVGGEQARMALHASSDMHSVEWGTLQWLFTKEQLVGTFTYDRFHTVTNCRTQALTQSGLMFMRLDWSVYLSCRRGPFKACANNYLMREAGQEIGNTQNCSNIVFRFLAPRFARDLDYRGGDVGSEQWYKGLWTQVVRRLQSSDIGVEDKKGRWWATESSTRLASSMCTITLFVLLWLGFKRKWWHSLDKSPLASTSLICQEVVDPTAEPDGIGLEAAEGADDDAGGDEEGEAKDDADAPAACALTVTAARERLRTARKKLASTLHYTAKVLCKDSTRRINHGIAKLTQPVEVRFHLEMTQAKSRKEFLNTHLALVFEGYSEVLMDVWNMFTSADFAEFVEFSNCRDVSPFVRQMDNVVGKALFRFSTLFIGAIHRVHVQYQMSFPLKFLQLLDKDATRRELALKLCEASWTR